ncbi:MAG: hypothetical protein ACYTX0_47200, partial [Nostoc sp.]
LQIALNSGKKILVTKNCGENPFHKPTYVILNCTASVLRKVAFQKYVHGEMGLARFEIVWQKISRK